MKTYKKLKFVGLKEFDLWDIKRYTSKKLKSTFNIEKLSNCIKEENRKYKLYLEEDKTFGILGVNNKDGIFDAYEQKGKEINQPYKKMEIGWLAYNPYRINVGSIGIRKKEHLYQYISPAYVVFSCLDNLLPEYLYLLFRTERFIKIINESTTGSVRQNLTSEILKTLEIPLPSISEQETIVKKYYDKITQATTYEQQAETLEKNIESYLFESLGIEQKTEQKTKKKGLQFVEFYKMDFWGVDYNFSSSDKFFESVKFENTKLKNVALINPITSFPNDENLSISFIPMECISDKEGKVIEQRERLIKESKGYTKFQNGDLLWARITPCMQNGKSAIVSNLKNGYGVGSTEYHIIRQKNTEVELKYIYNILRMNTILQKAMSFFTGSAGQQRVPRTFLEELTIPIPPKETQQAIINQIDTYKNEIKILRERATLLKQQAEQEFEQTIFS